MQIAKTTASSLKTLFVQLTDSAYITLRDNAAYDSQHVPPLSYGMAPGEASVSMSRKAKSTILSPEQDAEYTPIINTLMNSLRDRFDHTHVVFSEYPDGRVKLTVSEELLEHVTPHLGTHADAVITGRTIPGAGRGA